MTSRDRRAVLIGGATVLAAVMILRIAPAMRREHAELRVRVREQTALVQRARYAVSAAPAKRDSLAMAVREIVALAPKLVAGETATEAKSRLTADFSRLAQRAGLNLLTITPGSDTSLGTFRPLELHGRLEGPLEGLVAFLAAVESDQQLLSVRTLRILGDDNTAHSVADHLRIDLTVVGWRLEVSPS